MGFSRPEPCSEQPFPSPGDFPIQGLNPGLPHCSRFFTSWPQGKPKNTGVNSLPFSSRSSWPRNRTRVSYIAGGFLTNWATNMSLMVYKVHTLCLKTILFYNFVVDKCGCAKRSTVITPTKRCEVTNVLINLIVGIISQCIHTSNYRITLLKEIWLLLISYTFIGLGEGERMRIFMQGLLH